LITQTSATEPQKVISGSSFVQPDNHSINQNRDYQKWIN